MPRACSGTRNSGIDPGDRRIFDALIAACRHDRERRNAAASGIAKWLARAGVASRRDAEKLLAEGRVRLNNAPVTHPATFVARATSCRWTARAVESPERTRLWRYHKPAGLMTTHRDPEGRPTVFEQAAARRCRAWSASAGSTWPARGCCC